MINVSSQGNGQKSMPPRRRGSVQQSRSLYDTRSVLSVREHGKKATCLREALRRRQGTPLAAFFNIPSIEKTSP
jgi:hypothetical protein